MKQGVRLFYILFFPIACCLSVQAQDNIDGELTFEEIVAYYESLLSVRMDSLVQDEIQSYRWNTQTDTEKIAFTTDTLFIEYLQDYLQKDHRCSTIDIIWEKEQRYRKLLNTYSQRIVKLLPIEHQQEFKDTQNNWLTYDESEKQIVTSLISHETYAKTDRLPLILSSQYYRVGIMKQRLTYLYKLLEYLL